jgi:hypothetical protein
MLPSLFRISSPETFNRVSLDAIETYRKDPSRLQAGQRMFNSGKLSLLCDLARCSASVGQVRQSKSLPPYNLVLDNTASLHRL